MPCSGGGGGQGRCQGSSRRTHYRICIGSPGGGWAFRWHPAHSGRTWSGRSLKLRQFPSGSGHCPPADCESTLAVFSLVACLFFDGGNQLAGPQFQCDGDAPRVSKLGCLEPFSIMVRWVRAMPARPLSSSCVIPFWVRLSRMTIPTILFSNCIPSPSF